MYIIIMSLRSPRDGHTLLCSKKKFFLYLILGRGRDRVGRNRGRYGVGRNRGRYGVGNKGEKG